MKLYAIAFQLTFAVQQGTDVDLVEVHVDLSQRRADQSVDDFAETVAQAARDAFRLRWPTHRFLRLDPLAARPVEPPANLRRLRA